MSAGGGPENIELDEPARSAISAGGGPVGIELDGLRGA